MNLDLSKVRGIAFWLSGAFRLPVRWCAPPWPIALPATVVMDFDQGPVPIGHRKAAIFIWYPSGFLTEVGLAPHTWARAIASEIAELIGGPLVDGRS